MLDMFTSLLINDFLSQCCPKKVAWSPNATHKCNGWPIVTHREVCFETNLSGTKPKLVAKIFDFQLYCYHLYGCDGLAPSLYLNQCWYNYIYVTWPHLVNTTLWYLFSISVGDTPVLHRTSTMMC